MATLDDNIPIALQDCVIEDIRFGEEIGKGANGRILEARWEGVTVAVKEIHSIFLYVSEPEFLSFKRSFVRECEQSSRLRHPNIVRFFGIYYPPNARVPSLVMERLHCSLTKLLEDNPDISIGRKLSIICDVSRGLRYLHTRAPPIIHRDLSSNNVLISKRMEGKIGDLGTARLVDTSKQSQMTKAPGTVVFMPPEALEDSLVIRYSKELDVFSFGCVMLHTLSHQWPTPLPSVVTDPETGLVKGGRSEVERRRNYFDRIDRSIADVLTPLIENCLNNLPEKRTSIMRVCEQLGDLVDKECVPIDDLTMSTLQEEIQKKENEIQRKDAEILIIQQNMIDMQTEIQRKDTEIQSLTSEIQDIQRNNVEVQNEIQRKDTEIQSLTSEIQDIQRNNVEVQNEIQRKDTEIQSLTSEIQDIQRNNVEVQNEIQRKDTEIQSLTSEIQDFQRNNVEVQNEIQRKNIEISNKDIEIKALRSKMLSPKQVNKSSSDFWNYLKVTWQQCADLPRKCWATSVAELEGNVYVTVSDCTGGYDTPFVYDTNKDQWSILPKLPCWHFSLVVVYDKKQLLAIGGITRNNTVTNNIFLWNETDKKWLTSYPNMPTARYRCSSISHKSTVIVAGGVLHSDPNILTRVVEVLHNIIKEHSSWFSKSNWSVVEALPLSIYEAVPFIVNDILYMTVGYGTSTNSSTCNVVTASLPELLQSSNNNTSSSQVWSKLPDMPFAAHSINYYQGRLITFTGGHWIKHSNKDKPTWESVPLIHIYNPETMSWDCVGDVPHGYYLGKSVHVSQNKILFVGGLTGSYRPSIEDNIVTACSVLTFTH